MSQEKNDQETDVIDSEPLVSSLGGNGGGGRKDGGHESSGGGGEGLAHIGGLDGREGGLDSEPCGGYERKGTRLVRN